MEGGRYDQCLRKIEWFFQEPRLNSLEFAILLIYTFRIKQGLSSEELASIISNAKEITRRCQNKSIALISIEKEYEKIENGIRGWSFWFWGTPKSVSWVVLKNGEESEEKKYSLETGQ